jgi:kynurenine formamidase
VEVAAMRPLTGLLASLALAVAVAGDPATTPAPGDSRADPSGLPAGVAPWWPSRYGADDQIGDRFYNGGTVQDIVEPWGLARLGIESVPPIVTRGILVDMASYKGNARLDKGYVVTIADLEGALATEGLRLRPGDAVLFHTGWGGLWGKDNDTFLSGEPGPGLDLIEHLYDARVALVGADTWSLGPVPGEDVERPFLVPQTLYVKMGLFGLENLATEVLADTGVHEFLFVLTHAKTRGSTAAVVAPAALY